MGFGTDVGASPGVPLHPADTSVSGSTNAANVNRIRRDARTGPITHRRITRRFRSTFFGISFLAGQPGCTPRSRLSAARAPSASTKNNTATNTMLTATRVGVEVATGAVFDLAICPPVRRAGGLHGVSSHLPTESGTFRYPWVSKRAAFDVSTHPWAEEGATQTAAGVSATRDRALVRHNPARRSSAPPMPPEGRQLVVRVRWVWSWVVATSTVTVLPSTAVPLRISSEAWSAISRWITRFSGRAPNDGS